MKVANIEITNTRIPISLGDMRPSIKAESTLVSGGNRALRWINQRADRHAARLLCLRSSTPS
jgi:hypothetical protein